jgi:hypothetical protein
MENHIMTTSSPINEQPTLNLYLVSFAEFTCAQYDSFVVAAYTEEEAAMLTPNFKMNKYLGTGMGYDYPVTDTYVRYYIDKCGQGQSVTWIGEARGNIEWGSVPISSFN